MIQEIQEGKPPQNENLFSEKEGGKAPQSGQPVIAINTEKERGKATQNDETKRRVWIELANKDISRIKRMQGIAVSDSKKNQALNSTAVESFIQEQLKRSKEQARVYIDDFAEEVASVFAQQLRANVFGVEAENLKKELEEVKAKNQALIDFCQELGVTPPTE
ncbi:MAG: hypothetical protein WC617_17545 [Rhodanobacter sp.]|jgi:hypothetical protein